MAREESEQPGMLRVHILEPEQRDVYFEVRLYRALTAEAEYRQHKEGLFRQFDVVTISDLRATSSLGRPAYEYSIEWEHGRRRVLVFEREDATYRVIYNPLFAINEQILSTLEWQPVT